MKQTRHKKISLLWRCITRTVILFCVLGGILEGLFMLEVTPELQQRLNHASLIENTWHQLSKKEQDRLEAIAQGRAFDKLDKKIKKLERHPSL